MGDDRSQPEKPSEPGRAGGEHWYERVLSAVGWRPPSIRDDLEDALAETDRSSDLSLKERAMLRNVLSLRERRVDDIMVPRADIIAVSADATLGDVLALFRTVGHSRLPVYGETLDDPHGMVHIRDFVDFVASRVEAATAADKPRRPAKSVADLGIDLTMRLSAAKILRPVLFVPPSMPALDLLVKMQATRTHMALVIDEYGGTDGLVSMEDVVEMVVGDIEDEHDAVEGPMVVKGADGVVVSDARAGLSEVSEALGFDLITAAAAEGVDTIGGFVGMLAGRVPARGELIKGPGGLEFEVLDADPRRVKRLRIHRREETPRRRPRRDIARATEAPRTASSEHKRTDRNS
jgi:CBS domain containing-hemolysin-like protein